MGAEDARGGSVLKPDDFLTQFQEIAQPLWSTVELAPFEEKTSFRFISSLAESANFQLQGSLPLPQSFVLGGFELRAFGSLSASEISKEFPLASFFFWVGDKSYADLPLGAILWNGTPEFRGFQLSTKLLLDPQTHFNASIYWKRPVSSLSTKPKNFRLSLTLLLLGVLRRPIA